MYKEDIEILEEITEDDLLNCWEGGEKEFIAIKHLIKAYKELEEENTKLRYELFNSIPKAKVEEILKKEELPNVIVGGRRNSKTLNYGKKLGRIELCKELLKDGGE